MAEPDRHALRRRREALRKWNAAELASRCDPFDPTLEGVLYEPQVLPELAAGEREALEREQPWRVGHLLRAAGRLLVISGGPLSSSEPAPFAVDGEAYASVWCFCQALKLDADDPRRAAVAGGQRRGRVRPAHAGWFEYAEEQIAVNSRQHGYLVVRATHAKVLAHPRVQDALAATGSMRLMAGGRWSGALGRYMPLALMAMRLKLFNR